MMLLRAQAVGVADSKELQCITLGFAAQAGGDGPALLLQRAFAFDEQDVELGMDTYSLVTNTQATTYGGVVSYALEAGHLELTLTPKAALELGVDQELVVRFAPDRTKVVHEALERILNGAPAPKKAQAAAMPRKRRAPRKRATPRPRKKATPRKRTGTKKRGRSSRSSA